MLGAVREIASKDYSPAQIAAWSEVDRAEWDDWRLTRPAWLAEIDTVAVGFTDLEPDGHLDMMLVHPDFQGIGVATALLGRVEAEARKLSLACIFAEASIPARPFFERRDFRITATQTVECRGRDLTNYRVEKELV